jgi:hypothetical protein
MVDLSTLKAEDLQGLSPGAVTELAARMLAEIKHLGERAERDARTPKAHQDFPWLSQFR